MLRLVRRDGRRDAEGGGRSLIARDDDQKNEQAAIRGDDSSKRGQDLVLEAPRRSCPRQ